MDDWPEFSSRTSFTKTDLEQCADGVLFGTGNAQLPSAPLLMLDRILEIQAEGGAHGNGYAVAEFDVRASSWFFKHHFQNDPVMPGCLLIEGLWQLAGFHLAWTGSKGKGRVIDSGRTRFLGEITGDCCLKISVDIRKIVLMQNPICIANGKVEVGDTIKCQSESIKIGLF